MSFQVMAVSIHRCYEVILLNRSKHVYLGPVLQCRRLRLLADESPVWEEQCRHRLAELLALLVSTPLTLSCRMHLQKTVTGGACVHTAFPGHGWTKVPGHKPTGARQSVAQHVECAPCVQPLLPTV